MFFPPNSLPYTTAGGGEKLRVKAGCQHVKLQLLISALENAFPLRSDALLRRIPLATTGGAGAV